MPSDIKRWWRKMYYYVLAFSLFIKCYKSMYFLFACLKERSTFVGSAWSFGFFIPAKTVNDLRLRRMFYPRLYPLNLFSYLNSWERASIFPFKCSVLNKGTPGTMFITSLVWRGPWLGIEPGTSRTRCQHSTTRLSRRRYFYDWLTKQAKTNRYKYLIFTAFLKTNF